MILGGDNVCADAMVLILVAYFGQFSQICVCPAVNLVTVPVCSRKNRICSNRRQSVKKKKNSKMFNGLIKHLVSVLGSTEIQVLVLH